MNADRAENRPHDEPIRPERDTSDAERSNRLFDNERIGMAEGRGVAPEPSPQSRHNDGEASADDRAEQDRRILDFFELDKGPDTGPAMQTLVGLDPVQRAVALQSMGGGIVQALIEAGGTMPTMDLLEGVAARLGYTIGGAAEALRRLEDEGIIDPKEMRSIVRFNPQQ